MNKDVKNLLSLEDLDDITGGRISLAGYGMLTALMVGLKKRGYDKEHCLQIIREGWAEDMKFKTVFTDQTDEDLQNALDFVNRTW